MSKVKTEYLGKTETYNFKVNSTGKELNLKCAKAELRETIEKFSTKVKKDSTKFEDYVCVIEYNDIYLNELVIGKSRKEVTLGESIPKSQKAEVMIIDEAVKGTEIEKAFVGADEVKTSFQKLNAMSCKTEKKGNFTYIPWSSAWKKIKEFDPNANFEVHTTEQGFPAFIKPKIGGFVKVSVTLENQTHTEFHAIMNNYNKAILEPTSTDINNSIKRCLVKVLAYFGFGLSLYEGEELPSEEEEEDFNSHQRTKDK